MSFEIRKYSAGDEKKILELFFYSFNKEMTLDYWEWRFKNNPYGDVEATVAFDGDKMIAHYAVSPINFELSGKSYKAAHSMTTMTHPDYQGKGLFNKLANSLYSELKLKSYDFVWGFPNSNSYPGFVKNLNWEPLSQIPTLKCTDAGSESGEIQIEEKNAFFSQDEMSELQKIESGQISIRKDLKYLLWRYKNNPEYKYRFLRFYEKDKIVACAVVKEYQDEIDLLDLISLKDLTDKVLLSLRFQCLSRERKKGLNAWVNIQQDSYLSFLKNKFSPQMPITYLGYLDLSGRIKKEVFSNPLSWNFSMGDSDVF